ncbi:hypothetical protein SAMN04488057_114100 [Cyclobacterium lianum]|uniref:Lipocalin-like domain-containing protein n=1 Tax=Cyclobacterium lianum TaxID=388280 RepID=A0A1M7Q718_9BACT|nr:hypothetical protein [Cyclobacterium lianum]SHN26095.1 hypothetical protein SAMN04488057_114100 [Cyclobacterium lianum]
MRITVFTFVFGLLLFSCMEDQNLSALEAGPIPVGNWTNLEYQENGIALEKVDRLRENTYGYRFLGDGKLIHRANSGWCGTPPIITSDYEGTWEREGEILTLTAPYWGGTQVQKWKIIASTANTLQVEVISQELQMDE